MDGLPQPVLKKFSDLGCDIYIGGPIWDICDATAKKYIAKMKAEGKTCHYIHPFDSAVVWDGHSTLAYEVMVNGRMSCTFEPFLRGLLPGKLNHLQSIMIRF